MIYFTNHIWLLVIKDQEDLVKNMKNKFFSKIILKIYKIIYIGIKYIICNFLETEDILFNY